MMRIAPLLTSASLLAVIPLWQGGDRPNPDRPDRDPPSRVGRLSFVGGSVSFRPGDVDDWVAATVNYPLHDGDHLWTDSDARAEITVGSTAFRLAPLSAFGFLALDDRTAQVRLSQGALNVRVRDLGDDESLEIDTPSGAVSLLRSGVYRVDVDTTGDKTSVTLLSGEAGVWAPYRYGHWAWVEPWGWTWIDDAPWGFAPFHYGRWVYVGGGWAWVPGRVAARPVYAPALVVFVGGRNWSLAIAGGSGVAWFPLAPEEPYVPAYRARKRSIRHVNVTNVNVTDITVTNVNVKNINSRNRRERDGVTVVSRETFVGSRPVSQGVIVVPRDRLDRASVVGATAQIAPGRRSVLGQPTIIAARHPPPAVTTREVVVQRPPPPPPVPFAAREQALRARPGRPLDDTTLGTLRARPPAGHVRPLVRPAVPPTAEGPLPPPPPPPPPPPRPAREGSSPPPRPRERPPPPEPLAPR